MGLQSAHCRAGVEMGGDLPQRGSRAQRSLHIPRPVIDGVAGAAAGFVSRMAVQPFDVLKIRFQVQLEPVSKVLAPTSTAGPSKYTGLLQATGIIVKEEGWKGLWKGIVPAQLLVVPYTAIQFVVVHKFKSLVAKSAREEDHAKLSPSTSFIGGALAGTSATLGSYPFDLVRTILASQGEPKVYANMSEAIVGIAKKKGIRGLYAGLAPTLVQIVPYAGLQFSSYDLMKKTCMMWNRKMAARKAAQRSGNVADAGNESLSSLQHIWCGLFAGTFSKTCCHPLDVVRKRFQVRGLMRNPRYGAVVSERMYQGMIDCFRRILAEEGVAGLYKGTVPSVIKAAPAAAITFVVYETVCRWLTSLSVADNFGEHGKGTKGGEVE